ncbi:MAG: hypothetical protein Q9163_005337 [Psora crenata]
MATKLGLLCLTLLLQTTYCGVVSQIPLRSNGNISIELFNDLEELSRIVDIAYCVGLTGTGIQKPFLCASRCQDFDNFELVTTWNTGQLLSDSCGYIVLSHPPSEPRIILAFRGTYSVANTIVDLSTIPQEYAPYPGDDGVEESDRYEGLRKPPKTAKKAECLNCAVHLGFMKSWQYTKPLVLPYIKEMVQKYPEYKLVLVGHSLGGAVAALASLEFEARGWNPQVTTFGEPKIGNEGLVEYLDKVFARNGDEGITHRYRRVTHVDDPVPLLPLTEWGYQPHAGEIYISKLDLPPQVKDLRSCKGDADPDCIAGAENGRDNPTMPFNEQQAGIKGIQDWWKENKGALSVPPRWRIWQIFFAHRDYFWRLGLCVPWHDYKDWYSQYPEPP